jgi:hypothetical protein
MRTRRPASRWASGWATPSTISPRSSSPRARSSPRRPTSRSGCCRRCAAPPPGPTPTSSRPRAWPMAIRRASSAPSRNGNRSASTASTSS